MKTVKVEIEIFKFDELSDYVKSIVIQKQRCFLLYSMSVEDYKNMTEEQLNGESPINCYLNEYKNIEENDEPVIESINASGYWFFKDGKYAGVVEFCGNHPRKGESILNFKGKEYII